MSKKIKRIDATPDVTWEQRALVRVEVYAKFNSLFMCEDVAEWARKVTELPDPPEPRAWGYVMIAAQRALVVTGTDLFAKTQYGAGHSKPMRLWTAAA